mmetsp:Transcript_29199/g.52848  ORF Transcript_29199/g.52848 Transcript_29199/m.52848 type:complete len:352 (-) Transcript_29199:824-1879(-)
MILQPGNSLAMNPRSSKWLGNLDTNSSGSFCVFKGAPAWGPPPPVVAAAAGSAGGIERSAWCASSRMNLSAIRFMSCAVTEGSNTAFVILVLPLPPPLSTKILGVSTAKFGTSPAMATSGCCPSICSISEVPERGSPTTNTGRTLDGTADGTVEDCLSVAPAAVSSKEGVAAGGTNAGGAGDRSVPCLSGTLRHASAAGISRRTHLRQNAMRRAAVCARAAPVLIPTGLGLCAAAACAPTAVAEPAPTPFRLAAAAAMAALSASRASWATRAFAVVCSSHATLAATTLAAAAAPTAFAVAGEAVVVVVVDSFLSWREKGNRSSSSLSRSQARRKRIDASRCLRTLVPAIRS